MEKTIRVLNELLEEGVLSDYAIGGAIAATFWAEPVATYDLDVFIALPGSSKPGAILKMDKLYGRLKAKGYSPKEEHVLIEGIPVQFLPVYDDLVAEALKDAVPAEYGRQKMKVVGIEHLLAIMASVGRPKDRARIAQVMETAKPDLKRLGAILARHGLLKKWKSVLGEA